MEAAIHKRNLESSILFMQQEHANTLKALHEEIQKLQKKCSGKLSTNVDELNLVRKLVFGVSDQVLHNLGCTVTEDC